MTQVQGRSSYLDADAGSVDSAGRRLALAEDDHSSCALRPGVAGLSDGIRVVATVGRHFETSRVFAFGSGEASSVFLSSGDLGLAHDRQVDVAAPVDDPVHRDRLEATMEALLRFPAWEMDADGAWHRQGPGAEDALRQLAASGGISRGGRVSLR